MRPPARIDGEMPPPLVMPVPVRSVRNATDSAALREAAALAVDTLGHHLAVFGAALEHLRRRWVKGGFPAPLQTHLNHCLEQEKGAAEGVTRLALRIGAETAAEAKPRWLLHSDAPGWTARSARALLHLPGLRTFWGRQLRSNVLADLRWRLPPAWVLDTAALPPSSAIAGLGIASWGEFDRLWHGGRSFAVQFADEATPMELHAGRDRATWQTVASRLAQAASGSAWIETLPPSLSDSWEVVYALEEGRWEPLRVVPQVI